MATDDMRPLTQRDHGEVAGVHAGAVHLHHFWGPTQTTIGSPVVYVTGHIIMTDGGYRTV
jgi:hypothetical protein